MYVFILVVTCVNSISFRQKRDKAKLKIDLLLDKSSKQPRHQRLPLYRIYFRHHVMSFRDFQDLLAKVNQLLLCK